MWLATGDGIGAVRIWDATTEHDRLWRARRTDPVRAVAISPDGTWLATVSDDYDGSGRILNATTGDWNWDDSFGYGASVEAVAVSPDGTWLATASHDNEMVRIWDAITGYQRLTGYERLRRHVDQINGVAISPDGKWLATGSDDGTVRILDATTGAQRVWFAGHTRPVKAVAISPDGTWLATGSDDGSVRIWDAATGDERLRLAGPAGPVRAVAISPDCTWLAAGGGENGTPGATTRQ
jgi:WD40 repeat protein